MIIIERPNAKYFYGTIRECAEEVFRRIDLGKVEFKPFDFAIYVDLYFEEKYPATTEISRLASSWFGCKDVGDAFDSNVPAVMFCHYGGGGVTACEIDSDSLEDFISAWVESIDNWGDNASESDVVLVEYDPQVID